MFGSKSNADTRRDPFDARAFRRRALLMAGIAIALVYALWQIDALEGFVYPFRLFVTYVHEASHSLMAELTGGDIVGFTVNPDGSGFATTRGGTQALILPAGYLGAAFFGALLFYVTNTVRYTRPVSIALGAGLLAFTVLFSRPAETGEPTAFLVGIVFGALLIGMGWKANQTINILVLNMLAAMTSLHAVFDLFFLTRSTQVIMTVNGSATVRNDAAAFSEFVAPLIPPAIWAIIWAGLALLMLGVSAYFSIIRPMRRGQLWGRDT